MVFSFPEHTEKVRFHSCLFFEPKILNLSHDNIGKIAEDRFQIQYFSQLPGNPGQLNKNLLF
jgi:hypothetical protein